MRPAQLTLCVLLLAATGCVSPGGTHSYSVREQGDARIGHYRSSEWSFETGSFWIEGPEGLVFIDTQFIPSALNKQWTFAEVHTGKKPRLAVVLEPTPDRFNGTAWLTERDVPVVTSEQVRALIPAVHARWAPLFVEKYQPSGYPSDLVLPASFGRRTTELHAGGLTLKAHVLGVGSSPAHVVVEWEGHLFTGDLVTNGAHGWFEGGRVDAWLERLDELRALKPRWIHPGHGPTGGPELLDREADYLRAIQAVVAVERPQGVSTPEALERITGRVEERFPDYTHEFNLRALLRAEWARQAAALARSRKAG
jgi:glyoxylase-like metal-dependent hydrolase (beta-lactamase superfamily II)